jgi:hypothetical protein
VKSLPSWSSPFLSLGIRTFFVSSAIFVLLLLGRGFEVAHSRDHTAEDRYIISKVLLNLSPALFR